MAVRGTIWEPSVNHSLCIHCVLGHIAAAVLASLLQTDSEARVDLALYTFGAMPRCAG